MLFTNPLYRKIAILAPVPTYTKESPNNEFLMPNDRIILYNGIIIELKGISMEKINRDSKKAESFVFVRLSFQPAILEKKMIRTTEKPDIKMVLKSVRR
jgi:hypothetical protein